MRALKALENPGRTNPALPSNEDNRPSRSKFAAAHDWGFRGVTEGYDLDEIEAKLRAAAEAHGFLKTEEDRAEFKACFEAGVDAGFDARRNAPLLAEVRPRGDEPPRTPAEPQEQRLTPTQGAAQEALREPADDDVCPPPARFFSGAPFRHVLSAAFGPRPHQLKLPKLHECCKVHEADTSISFAQGAPPIIGIDT